MSEMEESIYGNQEIIRQHERGSKPIKVCRPAGLGRESVEDFQEENIYENKDADAGELYLTPTDTAAILTTFPQSEERYEPLNVNKGAENAKSKVSYPSPQGYAFKHDDSKHGPAVFKEKAIDQMPKGRNSREADTSQKNEKKKYLQGENVELQELTAGVAMYTPSGIEEKRENMQITKVHRCSLFLGIFGILLALAALVLAVLFGFQIIKVSEACECQKSIDEMKTEMNKMEKSITDLEKEVSRLKPQKITSSMAPSPIFTTHLPMTSLTPKLVSSLMTSPSTVSTGISASPSTSLPNESSSSNTISGNFSVSSFINQTIIT